MADIKRFSNKNSIENGAQENNLSMSDILISQHITGDNNDYKVTFAQAQAIPYGVCESLGNEDKTVNLVNYPSTFVAQVGNKVLIKFIHANTKGHVSDNTYPTLTVGGVTKPIAAQGKTIGAGAIVDNQIVELVLTPDYWNIDQNIREVTSNYTILTDGSNIYNTNQVNGALANYIDEDITNVLSDCNIPNTSASKTKYYRINRTTLNRPIVTDITTNDIRGLLEDTNLDAVRLQKLHCWGYGTNYASVSVSFHRTGYWNGTRWIYSKWKKIATTDADDYTS